MEKPQAERDGEVTQRLATTGCSCPHPPPHTTPDQAGGSGCVSFLPPFSLLLMFPIGPTQSEANWHRGLGKVPPSILLQRTEQERGEDWPRVYVSVFKIWALTVSPVHSYGGQEPFPCFLPSLPLPWCPRPWCPLPVHSALWKDWHWSWSSNTLATCCKEPTHWKRPWCWERQEEEGTTDEMIGWYHWLNGQEFEQTLGHSEGQGSLVCFSPWGCKELDTTERLNNNAAHLDGVSGCWWTSPLRKDAVEWG